MIHEFELKDGVIQNSGMFEGETIATPFFWEKAMEGLEDESVPDNDTCYDYFRLSPTDCADLDEYAGFEVTHIREAMHEGKFFRIFYRTDGFVIGQVVTEEVLLAHQEEAGEVEV